MRKYRKKPVVIEAVQWTGLNLEEIKAFVGKDLQYDIIDTAWEVGKGAPHVNMKIHTLEGDHECTKGDFIIKGINGEFYPCKPDIFEKTYEYDGKDSTGKTTNADAIRSMSDEEMAEIIMCPYDTAGKPADIMPCVKDGNIQELVSPEYCKKCMMDWLQSEVEE